MTLLEELYHHGILGQKWGIRRTPEELGHLTRKDQRWVKRKSEKITKKAKKETRKELRQYKNELLRKKGALKKGGYISAATMNAYNQKMAELMSEKVSNIRSPSGKIVQFVAKRGEVGVYMALADEGYNMQQLKNGVFGSGKIAYRKTVVNQVKLND